MGISKWIVLNLFWSYDQKRWEDLNPYLILIYVFYSLNYNAMYLSIITLIGIEPIVPRNTLQQCNILVKGVLKYAQEEAKWTFGTFMVVKTTEARVRSRTWYINGRMFIVFPLDNSCLFYTSGNGFAPLNE